MFVRILLTLPDSFPPSSSCHQMISKHFNIALADYLFQAFSCFKYALRDMLHENSNFTNEISKRGWIKNALRHVLFCTVTSRLLHDDAKIHAASAWLYNVLGNWWEMKIVFPRNILIRTYDLLVLFDISIRYD